MAPLNIQNQTGFLAGAWIVGFALLSCGPRKVDPLPSLPELPAFTQVQHPESYELSDVKAILAHPQAPKREDLKECDASFRKLEAATPSTEERQQAIRELVNLDPVAMHWCFYNQVLDLHDFLNSDALWSARQQKMVSTYGFLVPLAQAFRTEYRDSRYLRWAMKDYRRLSEWVFYRKLDLSPQATLELMDGAQNPYALSKKPRDQALSILEKYHIAPEVRAPAAEAPVSEPIPGGAPSEAPLVSTEAAVAPSEEAPVQPSLQPAAQPVTSAPAPVPDVPAAPENNSVVPPPSAVPVAP